MTTPEPEAAGPWAEPDWRPVLAPPMSDAFYRAVGDYCRAEHAKAEAEPQPESESPRGYAAWIPDPVPAVDDVRYAGLGGYHGITGWARAEPEPEAGL